MARDDILNGMRGRVTYGLVVSACCVYACADILGIDDGIPRVEDASIADSSFDVTTLPDVSSADVGIDVPMSPLSCGTTTCNALTENCCRTGDPSDASGESFACVSGASPGACDGGLVIVCDDAKNCVALGLPGDICCADVPDGGTIATSTSCVAPGKCNGAIMCLPGDDEVCKVDAGQTCKPSVATILGYTICK
jgi:hypothetical protein